MNRDSHTWIFVANMVLHGLLTATMLVVVWIGWLRQRKIGFVVLVVWALTALFSMAGQWVWTSLAQNSIQKLFPNASPFILAVLPGFVSSLVSSLLLLLGLALLVFRDPSRHTPKA